MIEYMEYWYCHRRETCTPFNRFGQIQSLQVRSASMIAWAKHRIPVNNNNSATFYRTMSYHFACLSQPFTGVQISS